MSVRGPAGRDLGVEDGAGAEVGGTMRVAECNDDTAFGDPRTYSACLRLGSLGIPLFATLFE